MQEKEETNNIRNYELKLGRIQVFLNLMTANQNRIYGYILSLMPQAGDADDILQETTLLMWEKFSDYRDGTDFLAWGMTIARYKALNFIRDKHRGGYCLDADVLAKLADESESFMREIDPRIEALHQCVKKLSGRDAQIINLRFRQEATVKSISNRLGRAEKTIYKAMGRIYGLLLRCVRAHLKLEEAL